MKGIVTVGEGLEGKVIAEKLNGVKKARHESIIKENSSEEVDFDTLLHAILYAKLSPFGYEYDLEGTSVPHIYGLDFDGSVFCLYMNAPSHAGLGVVKIAKDGSALQGTKYTGTNYEFYSGGTTKLGSNVFVGADLYDSSADADYGLLAKFNGDQLEAAWTYDDGTGSGYFDDIIALDNLLVAFHYSGASPYDRLTAINPDGSVAWSVGSTTGTHNGITRVGDYVAWWGSTSTPDGMVTLVDESGSLVASKAINIGENSVVSTLFEASDGIIALIDGATGTSKAVVKLDSELNVVKALHVTTDETLKWIGGTEFFGHYILVGNASISGAHRLAVIELDKDLNLISSKYFEASPEHESIGRWLDVGIHKALAVTMADSKAGVILFDLNMNLTPEYAGGAYNITVEELNATTQDSNESLSAQANPTTQSITLDQTTTTANQYPLFAEPFSGGTYA